MLNNPEQPDLYTPPSRTVAEWGNFTTPGAPRPLEFHYYAYIDFGDMGLTEKQIMTIMTTCVPCFGLNNIYNAARFVVAYQNDPVGEELSRFLHVFKVGQGNYII